MIAYDDFVKVTDRAGELYPPRGQARAWWAERGVDYEGLVRFCSEDGLDSAENIMPLVAKMHDATREQLVASGFAMSTEIGFLLGWIMCEKARA